MYAPLLEHSGFSYIITGMMAGQSVAVRKSKTVMLFCLFREALKKSPGCPFQTDLDICDFCIHTEMNIFLTFNNQYMLSRNFMAFCSASVFTFVSPWQLPFKEKNNQSELLPGLVELPW